MKKRFILKAALWTLLPAACFAALSFAPHSTVTSSPNFPFDTDTLPAITEFETGRLDQALNYVDQQIRNHGDAECTINTDRIQQQVSDALSKIDLVKIQSAARAAVKKIDFDQLNRDLEKAMAGIDRAKIDHDVSRAMAAVKNIDAGKLKCEINMALKDVKLDQLKVQLEAACRDLRLQQRDLNLEMRQLGPGINNELRDTRRQLQRLKDAYQEMERDGLIERGPNNRIQFREGELYINGERQSQKTSEKYRHYFNRRTPVSGTTVAV
ncbi:hypothetical protein [Niabella beijingensis]|uniref:hypothetical protein n=1 Tax=Niabella beijingensis TaxID=2872700 RepID=UPI001CBAE353|nr:hypothetical protein [Niabella beijingensis]MBZ4191275.1 hypothetical protein [Niabella beijingensis]